MTKILEVSGSPRKRGNTCDCLQEALKACSPASKTELVTLADLKIAECDGCNRCRERGQESFLVRRIMMT